MYRMLLRPRWLAVHLLVVVLVTVMVALGLWQGRRLQERRDFNDTVRDRAVQAVVPVAELLPAGAAVDPSALEWRTVEVRGRYLADEQVLVVNRAQGGVAGTNVVTPLELADGRLVLVQRGFVPQRQDVPPPPAGEAVVVGRLRASQERRLGQVTDPATGELDEVQRLDVQRLAPQLPAPVLPMYVDLLTSDPSQGALPAPLPDPELDEGPHLSYLLQWFTFALVTIGAWVVVVRRAVTGERRSRGVSGGGPGAAPSSPAPASDAATTAPR
jgi:cytochrome oxidase assembly protein ShyY1